mmetsp:Transcript_12351/g.37226  ORF Transcript_12351/g.37226 Transcript_12351/m.37226 type:complete len:236 (-) Transcript_12351:114-821(-)
MSCVSFLLSTNTERLIGFGCMQNLLSKASVMGLPWCENFEARPSPSSSTRTRSSVGSCGSNLTSQMPQKSTGVSVTRSQVQESSPDSPAFAQVILSAELRSGCASQPPMSIWPPGRSSSLKLLPMSKTMSWSLTVSSPIFVTECRHRPWSASTLRWNSADSCTGVPVPAAGANDPADALAWISLSGRTSSSKGPCSGCLMRAKPPVRSCTQPLSTRPSISSPKPSPLGQLAWGAD